MSQKYDTKNHCGPFCLSNIPQRPKIHSRSCSILRPTIGLNLFNHLRPNMLHKDLTFLHSMPNSQLNMLPPMTTINWTMPFILCIFNPKFSYDLGPNIKFYYECISNLCLIYNFIFLQYFKDFFIIFFS